jgi:arabinofuranosyltransferase
MRQRRCLPLSVGMAVYLVYVVAIGGDFMAGRFFTAVLLVAVVVVSRSPAAHAPRALLVVLALVICAGLVSPRAPLRSSLECTIGQPHFDPHGIADERAYYHAATGLLPAARGVRVPDHQWAAAGRAARAQGPAVLVADNIGFFGYEAGIAVHVVDRLALADPLLARLPYQATANWRVGHYPRELPQGYLETLRSGHNQITDPRTRRLYDALALVTRGPLLDPQRWTMIIRLNLLGQP